MRVKLRKRTSLQGRAVKLPHSLRELKLLTLSRLRQLIRTDGWTMKILLVMAGGSIGALSRYAVSLWAAKLLGTQIPLGHPHRQSFRLLSHRSIFCFGRTGPQHHESLYAPVFCDGVIWGL